MSLCESWITGPEDMCAPCVDDAAEVVARWGLVASSVLYALSGRQYPGVCEDTVTPNVECGCARPVASPSVLPGACGCGADRSAVLLPHRPVRAITEVVIDGETVDPAEYRIRDRRWLVRCEGSWPSRRVCEDFTITYSYGVRPPAGGAYAASVFACELARACAGDDGCRLPKHTQSIVQEGISQTLLVADPMQLVQNRMVGIAEVDNWVRAQNPNGIDRAGKVLLPRRPQTTRLR